MAARRGGGCVACRGPILAIFHVREYLPPAPEVLGLRTVQVPSFVLALFVATLVLFWVDPTNRYFSLFIGLFVAPPFSGEPGAFGLGPAVLLAAFGIAAVVALARLEAALIRRGARTLRMARAASLGIAVTAAVIVFFDFSLASEIATT